MIALEASERFWILKIGYDERFANCSPGLLLMHEALQYAVRQDLKSYEFLGAEADWTLRWTDRGRPTQRVLIYPYTAQGAALLVGHATGHLWRKMRRRTRDAVMLKRRQEGRAAVRAAGRSTPPAETA